MLGNISYRDILSRLDCSCLEYVLLAGEVIPNKHLNYWWRYLPDAVYANLYGSTEITVDCTCYIVDRQFEDDKPLPIGKPCINSDVFVLDENDCLVSAPSQTGGIVCARKLSCYGVLE